MFSKFMVLKIYSLISFGNCCNNITTTLKNFQILLTGHYKFCVEIVFRCNNQFIKLMVLHFSQNKSTGTKAMSIVSIDEGSLEALSAADGLRLAHVSPLREIGQPEHPSSPLHDGLSIDAVEQRLTTRITVIDNSALSRSCLMRCLMASEADFVTEGYRSVDEWRHAATHGPVSIVLLCATGRRATEMAVRQDIDFVIQTAPEASVVVISDIEDSAEIIGALERGAKGYISMKSSLDVAVAAIRLVKAGGTFAPAGGLMGSRQPAPPPPPPPSDDMAGRQGSGQFTVRQLEVLESLRKGEPNKIIAYKLNMGECTVKVHVRNIMRKLKARSRTEIAFLTKDLF
jgi:DNA-binding NarL/FixJ family response regulator